MSAYQTLYSVHLSQRDPSKRRTIHRLGSAELPTPSALAIVKYDDGAYYLLYLDDSGSELTDTLHDSVVAAMSQAEWEFGIAATAWSAAE